MNLYEKIKLIFSRHYELTKKSSTFMKSYMQRNT